jgi:two-component system chemotaxis response regulator CheB
MIRLLLVEDSLTIRDFLIEMLTQDGEIEIVACAKNGFESLALLEKCMPDVVLMDINMPIMDGLEATSKIMQTNPVPVVIMSATEDVKEVGLAMEAVKSGALALLEKPLSFTGRSEEISEFLNTIKAMSSVKVVKHRQLGFSKSREDVKTFVVPGIEVIGIATSTGGPAALQTLLSILPGDYPIPILVVQHIVKGFTAGMVNWLDGISRLRVRVAQQGEHIAPGNVYIANEGFHLGIDGQKRLLLIDAPPFGGFKPSANVLFESLAEVYGDSVLALILTGMGRDGVEGLTKVHNRRGTIIAQNEETCAVFGMPLAAVEAGLTDRIMSLQEIGSHLMGYYRSAST